MESTRRNRRRGLHSNRNRTRNLISQPQKAWAFLNTLISFLVTAVLIAITYAMLEQHCHNCMRKFDISYITKDISNMAVNLFSIKNNYDDLEKKLSIFSDELPKLEGQIDLLEALARNVNLRDFGDWSSKKQLVVPNKVEMNRLMYSQNSTFINPFIKQHVKDKPR